MLIIQQACKRATAKSRFEWVAVSQWDSDNPHTHVILRGKMRDGRDLVIPGNS